MPDIGPGRGERVDRAVDQVGRVAERDAEEALEDAVDAEARAGRDHEAVVAGGEGELRADRGAEVHPHREAALGVRDGPLRDAARPGGRPGGRGPSRR